MTDKHGINFDLAFALLVIEHKFSSALVFFLLQQPPILERFFL